MTQVPNLLHTSVEYLRGVGKQRAELLKSELGIEQYQDLLNLFPNRYIDRTKFYKSMSYKIIMPKYSLLVRL